MFEDFINQFGPQILYTFLTFVGTALGGFLGYLANRIRKKYEEKVNDVEKRNIIKNCVKYAEQCCLGHGEEKYEFAFSAAVEILNEKGIPYGESEIKMLIESFVYSFKELYATNTEEEA